MPNSILEIAKEMAETQKIRDAMPAPKVVVAPMPGSEEEYNNIF